MSAEIVTTSFLWPEVSVQERGLGEDGTNRDLPVGERRRLAFIALVESVLMMWTPSERRRFLVYVNAVFEGAAAGDATGERSQDG